MHALLRESDNEVTRMGFYTLVDDASDSDDSKPWLNEFLELNPKTKDGLIFLVSSVKATKKGYILFTDEFNCFIWRNSKPGKALQDGLSESVQAPSYPQLAIMIKTKTTARFTTGFLDDMMAEYQWDPEATVFTLAPQKSLPLETPSNAKK